MARKSGCPFSIKDYVVDIENQVTATWVPVKGLTSMSISTDADTNDNKGGDAIWAEPSITGRSLSLSLEGRPIFDKVTGAKDPGQDLMDEASMAGGGCDNDQRVRITDSVGHSTIVDCIVTGKSNDADEDGETISYDLEGVGAPEPQDYIQAMAVSAKQGGTTLDSTTNKLQATVNDTAEVTIAFTPDNASNQKYAISIADKGVLKLVSMDGGLVVFQGVSAGSTTVNIKTMNNNLTTSFGATVTAD